MKIYLYCFEENWADGIIHYFVCESIEKALALFQKNNTLDITRIDYIWERNHYRLDTLSLINYSEPQYLLTFYELTPGELKQERIR